MRFHLCLLAIVAVSCSYTPPEPEALSLVKLSNQTFTLSEVWRVSETDTSLLRPILDLDVAGDGLVLAAEEKRIHVFDSTGSPVGVVGSYGRGPGEFVWLNNIRLIEQDSLFTYDSNQRRVSIFSREENTWALAYDFTIDKKTSDGYTVLETYPGTNSGQFISTESLDRQGFRSSGFVRQPARIRLHRNPTDSIPGTLLGYDHHEFLLTPTAGGGSSYAVVPNARQSILKVGDQGRFHLAPWNDRLWIVAFSAEGDSIGGIDLPMKPYTLSDSAHAALSFVNPVASGHVPQTLPSMLDFVVADNGDYWVNMGLLQNADHVWAVFSAEGSLRGSTRLNKNIKPRLVRGDLVYASVGGEENPAVAVFRHRL